MVKAGVTPGNRRGNGRDDGASAQEEVLGLSVRPITPQEKQQVDTTGSVVVDSVSGPARRAGLQPGDIVLGVGATNVDSIAELRAAVGKARGSQVPLRIQREDRIQFAQVQKEQKAQKE